MPIRIPNDLPAVRTLEQENIFVMTEKRAMTQDIRPLEILLLNLMPKKIETETQLSRLLGNTPLQIHLELMCMKSHQSLNTAEQHLHAFYRTFDELRDRTYDGMIITGAPVEQMAFEEVDYWPELCEIMEWSKTHVHSTFHICWGAQAGLYYHYGVQKRPLSEKLFGVFRHSAEYRQSILLRGFDDTFYVPHSRHTTVLRSDVEAVPELRILASSPEAGVYAVFTNGGKQIFITGHAEYDADTLRQEYLRDVAAGKPIDLEEIAEYGKKGVLLYLGESTNIERPGYTMSEKVVGTTLEHIFAENADRRIVIATFASNVHRLQQIVDIAVKYRRKVALSGRSMFNVVEAAAKIGEITIPEGVLVDVEKTKNFFDREIVIISTGSQGEPMSALTRMAAGEFNKVTIGANDTVVISASPIPGNERMIYRVINNLYKKGANVVYESLEKIHVSGHACQVEHKIMHALLKPKFFIPVHGEYRHLKRHALLAQEMGMSPSQIFIPDIGMCAEVTDDTLRQGDSFPAGARLIDGAGFEDYGTSEVLKDRIRMSGEGLFVVSVALSKGVLLGEPVIESRGFVFSDERDYMRDLKDVVEKAIEGVGTHATNADISAAIRRAVKNYLFKKTKQSPMILPIVQEV